MEKPTKDFSRVSETEKIDLYFKWSAWIMIFLLSFGPLISAWGGI